MVRACGSVGKAERTFGLAIEINENLEVSYARRRRA
jgi:hypothetical protein